MAYGGRVESEYSTGGAGKASSTPTQLESDDIMTSVVFLSYRWTDVCVSYPSRESTYTPDPLHPSSASPRCLPALTRPCSRPSPPTNQEYKLRREEAWCSEGERLLWAITHAAAHTLGHLTGNGTLLQFSVIGRFFYVSVSASIICLLQPFSIAIMSVDGLVIWHSLAYTFVISSCLNMSNLLVPTYV
jgi:hypothetical protein